MISNPFLEMKQSIPADVSVDFLQIKIIFTGLAWSVIKQITDYIMFYKGLQVMLKTTELMNALYRGQPLDLVQFKAAGCGKWLTYISIYCRIYAHA